MRADSYKVAVDAVRWLGRELTNPQLDQLRTFKGLLGSEATRAGGIGPNELDRLWRRHIGDSLLFGLAMSRATTCIDVGSGVGLPGIPLAIAYPEAVFELVDRSGRRCDLIGRMLAVLKLGNCRVVHKDIADVDNNYEALVSRAAMPQEQLMIHVKRLLQPTGVAVIGHSWTGSNRQSTYVVPDGLAVEHVRVPVNILDSPVNLLRIEPT